MSLLELRLHGTYPGNFLEALVLYQKRPQRRDW
jgi:hypothetical protein